jgi:hypothetical protein
MFFKNKPGKHRAGPSGPLRCSFCGKAEAEVAKLIAGQAGFICDECVRVCTSLITGEGAMPSQGLKPEGGTSPLDRGPTAFCAFCGRPVAWDEAVLVPEEGAYCPACVAADSKPRT